MKYPAVFVLSMILLLSGCAASPKPAHPEGEGWGETDPFVEETDRPSEMEPLIEKKVEEPSKSRWEGPQMPMSWHLAGYSGLQHFLGGKFGKVIEPFAIPAGSSMAVNLPVGKDKAITPYIFHEVFAAEVKHVDMGWTVSTLGAGLRYNFFYVKDVDVYAKADGAYARWEGRSDDRITHPDFDLTLFKEKGTIRYEPRDLDGFSVGLGVGFHAFVGDWLGLGLEWAWRYHYGTEGFDAHWFEWGSNLLFRF